MELSFQYGEGRKLVHLDDRAVCERLETNPLPALPKPADAVRMALRNSIGTAPLAKLVKPGERVAVIVKDITRLVHSEIFLPVLIYELNAAGIPDRDIFIVFALGILRCPVFLYHFQS